MYEYLDPDYENEKAKKPWHSMLESASKILVLGAVVVALGYYLFY